MSEKEGSDNSKEVGEVLELLRSLTLEQIWELILHLRNVWKGK